MPGAMLPERFAPARREATPIIAAMHLLVPFASDRSEACQHVLRDLRAAEPRAPARPARASTAATRPTPTRSRRRTSARSPPRWGWHGGDGLLPFAAHAAAGDGIATGAQAWALAHAGALAARPRRRRRCSIRTLLALDAAESRALFASAGELLSSEGFAIAWGAADRWYAARDDLQTLATASLDRVIGRNVDRWLGTAPGARRRAATRRRSHRWCGALQSEAQLLFHEHPVNDAREERGALAVNSFWLSGCGRAQPAPARSDADASAATLRAPLLAGDWAAWAEAWRALDAAAIAPLLGACARRRGDDAHALRRARRGALRRCARARSGSACAARAATAHDVLAGL